MARIKIYYHQFIGDLFDDNRSPFDLENVGLEPVPYIAEFSKDKMYYECPAWSHKTSRTYNILCPVDMDYTILDDGRIVSRSLPQTLLDNFVAPNSSAETLQVHLPRFLFWTNHKNLWMESKPYPYTASTNNLVSVGGWWNLSAWTRPLSFAFDVVDPTKPVVINRGDPVLQVCFYSKNLNDSFELIKKQPPPSLVKETYKRTLVKNFLLRHTNQLIFKDQPSKCPFYFLFKNART